MCTSGRSSGHVEHDGARRVALDRERHDLVEARRPQHGSDATGLQPGQVEQVVDEPLQPRGGLLQGADEGRAVGVVEVEVRGRQAVDRGADGRQRRAQVVRDGGQQRGAGGVGLRRGCAPARPGRAAAPAPARSRPATRRPPAPGGRSRAAPDPSARAPARRRRRAPPGPPRGRARGRRRPSPGPPTRPPLFASSETASSVNVSRSRATSAAAVSSPDRTDREIAARADASARARNASVVRRAARSTTEATPAATSTNTPSASAFSGSAMVSFPVGSVKNQLSSRKPTTALTMAGQSPPTSATRTVSARKSMRSVGRLTSVTQRREQER